MGSSTKCPVCWSPDEPVNCSACGAREDDEPTVYCGECGNRMTIVRPGKHQCDHCDTMHAFAEYKATITALQEQLADARLLARAMMSHEVFQNGNDTIVIQNCETLRQDLYACQFDSDNLPILTDEVRAALKGAVGE